MTTPPPDPRLTPTLLELLEDAADTLDYGDLTRPTFGGKHFRAAAARLRETFTAVVNDRSTTGSQAAYTLRAIERINGGMLGDGGARGAGPLPEQRPTTGEQREAPKCDTCGGAGKLPILDFDEDSAPYASGSSACPTCRGTGLHPEGK